MGNSPPPPPPPSTISKVLKSTSGPPATPTAERGRTRSNSNPVAMAKSPLKSNTSGKSKMTATELTTDTGMDALTEDKLLHIGHSKIAHSDNFLVKLPEGGLVRVKIADHEELNDRRIQPRDLRKILYEKPAIAGILFEAMLELGIAQADDIQEGENEDDESQSIQSMDVKDMITNNTPMFGRAPPDMDGNDDEDGEDDDLDEGLHHLHLSNDEEFA